MWGGNGSVLSIFFENEHNQNNTYNNFTKGNNKIIVELPCDTGNHAYITINGMGSVNSDAMRFVSGSLNINGSGNIGMNAFEAACFAFINGSGSISAIQADCLEININGSGVVHFDHVNHNTHVGVNGAGTVTLGNTTALDLDVHGTLDVELNRFNGGDFSAKVSGSATVKIMDGTCEKFDVDAVGSIDIDAKNLTARKAFIVLRENGEVTLGRVLENSTEQIKNKGRITVLKRG